MAKQTKKSFNQRQNKQKNPSWQTICKLERYCQNIFGMSFMEKMEDRILQIRKEFTDNILEHIKEAEKVTGQDYLEIKE